MTQPQIYAYGLYLENCVFESLSTNKDIGCKNIEK